MRTPSSRGLGARVVLVALVAIVGLVAVACGEAPASVAPTVAPTPIVTPDPHLSDPTTADEVYRGLGAAGLPITANNATGGGENADLVKRINATYQGWPLNISEFRSSAAVAKDTSWTPGEPPGQGEAPVAIAGANVVVTWGPQTGEEPTRPDARQVKAFADLVGALDRLLSPLRARTVAGLAAPGVLSGAVPGSSASPDATTADGEATPAP